MKRIIRLTALTLVIALAAVSLGSCSYLDKIKANTARYTDDSKTEVLFRGELYQKLDDDALPNDVTVNQGIYAGLWITDHNVPILLSHWYGDAMGSSRDGSILACSSISAMSYIPAESDYYHYGTTYYVREDKYDYVEEILSGGKLDHYFFNYWDESKYPGYYAYDSGTSGYGGADSSVNYDEAMFSDSSQDVLLDDEATAAINRALNSGDEEEVVAFSGSYTFLNSSKIHSVIPLHQCDEEMILTDGDGYSCFLVERLIDGDYTYYFTEGSSRDGKCTLYRIDKDGYSAVERYFTDYPYACESGDVLYNYAW